MELSYLTFVTPFQFMTVAEQAARVPGVTDDAPAFRAAHEYSRANGKNSFGNIQLGGVTLYIPAGTYRWATPVEIKRVTYRWVGESTGYDGGGSFPQAERNPS